LILAGSLLTYSRGAAIALVLLLGALILLKYVRPAQALGYTGVALLMAVLVAPGYMGRLATLSSVSDIEVGSRGQTESSLRGRAAEMLAALHIFLDHPLLGVGPGQTRLYTAAYGNQFGMKRLEGTRRGHNLYLEELADSGVVAFSVLMVIIGFTLRRLAQARHRWLASCPAHAELATGLLLSIGVYLATAMFLHLSYQRYFWLLIALAGTAIQLSRSDPVPEPVEHTK
jgi:O-antigen ligase